jgi:hypothetical protein
MGRLARHAENHPQVSVWSVREQSVCVQPIRTNPSSRHRPARARCTGTQAGHQGPLALAHTGGGGGVEEAVCFCAARGTRDSTPPQDSPSPQPPMPQHRRGPRAQLPALPQGLHQRPLCCRRGQAGCARIQRHPAAPQAGARVQRGARGVLPGVCVWGGCFVCAACCVLRAVWCGR